MGLSPRRVLFVFGWLVVGGEETEVRLLARRLDPRRYRLEVVACLRREGMPDQTERQLSELGVPVDTTPYHLSFEDTVEYLAGRVGAFDAIVATQAVPDIEPALLLASSRGVRVPPLIEHGGLVEEGERASALAARYVGVCAEIRDAAARRLGDPARATFIPSMVELDDFDPADRSAVRLELGFGDRDLAFGWVGRLDRKKRVEDFLRAARLALAEEPALRFVVIGGPDAFMPEYETELRDLAAELDLGDRVRFLGDRADVARLLSGLDGLVWLARGEGMPHVITEAGAARLPVVATRDNGTLEQIEDGASGLFVPHEDPSAVAAAMLRLARDPGLRERLGAALRRTVEERYSTAVNVPRWERLFDEVIAEQRNPRPTATTVPVGLPS
jgi:glycosyltransferase involved in cell wall biosynthesis